MVRSADVCLGAIVAIAIVLIAYVAWHRWHPREPSKFTYSMPASQELIKAAGDLSIVLQDIAAIGKQFDSSDCIVSAPPEICASIRSVTSPACMVAKKLELSAPTYANFHAVYRGLCDPDDCYLRVADVYIAKGRDLAQGVSPTVPSDAAALIGMGKQLQLLVRSVHGLGSALNLE